jgi:hypothetical protein
MAICIQADNRRLTTSSKYTFLNTNYASGVNSLSVLNVTDSDFAVGVPILVGNIGSEDAEILIISSVDTINGILGTTTVTLFAHPESTRITVLPYDKIRFFWTATQTFDLSGPLTGYIPLQVSDWFTQYSDQLNSTGYGWYCFYNSLTSTLSQPSNYVPYAGFTQSTTEDLLNDFFSMLSNKELRLVTREDALSWASEGYSRMRNKLNLTNIEYTASTVLPLNIVAGTYEYDLPTDFDHLVAILQWTNLLGNYPPSPYPNNFMKADIEFIPLTRAFGYKGSYQRYYIRGFKIGFVPTPTASGTYYYMYLPKAARLSSNTDEIILPNNGVYLIKDFMLYRCYMKFNNPLANTYYKTWTDGLNEMIIASVKRDSNLDTFGIMPECNV